MKLPVLMNPICGVGELERRGHGGQQHAEGEAAEAEAGEDAEHAGKNNHPGVVNAKAGSFHLSHGTEYSISSLKEKVKTKQPLAAAYSPPFLTY